MKAIESAIAPQPAWIGRTHGLNALSLERLMCSLSRAVQRAWRGWSDEDLWSLHQTLCQTLGAQLIALAEQTNGSPGDFDDWRDALHHHGQVLVTLGAAGVSTSDGAADRDKCEVAVRRSLLWVVDHLESLGW